MPIKTLRLDLRPLILDDDLDYLLALNNDPEVMEFLNGGKLADREEVKRDYRRRLARGAYYAAFERRSGDFVGMVRL